MNYYSQVRAKPRQSTDNVVHLLTSLCVLRYYFLGHTYVRHHFVSVAYFRRQEPAGHLLSVVACPNEMK